MAHEVLSWERRQLLMVLGLPSLGIALAYTFVTAYLPIFIEHLAGAAVTGLMIGGEGVFALFIPFLIGGWSDSLQTSLGKRLPFIFAGTLLIIITLLLMPFSSNHLFLLGIELAFFFIGYFTHYAAYYAIFPDLIPKSQRGRSQGVQGGFRSLGLFLAFVGGGFLLNVWKPLPFLLIIMILIIVTLIFYYNVRHSIKKPDFNKKPKLNRWQDEWGLIKNDRQIRLWFTANTLWEAAIGCLKVFVVLYFTQGLHFTLPQTAIVLSLVGISTIFAAPIAGVLADRYNHRPVILISVIFFAIGAIPPLFNISLYFVILILPIAFSAVILMTLPFSILMGFLPKENSHGAGAALFALSQGIGALIGPITAGLAVELLKHTNFLMLEKTKGYAAIFPVSSFFLLCSIPFAFAIFKKKSN